MNMQRHMHAPALAGVMLLPWLASCANTPLQPYSNEATSLVLASPDAAGVADGRGRFREIYCAVLEAHGPQLPDYRPCDQALTRLADEPAGDGAAVDLAPSRRHLVLLAVPGIGYDCFKAWLEPSGTVGDHLRSQGFEGHQITVDALSGSGRNAMLIRDALLALPQEAGEPRIVLLGYSKGAPDILEALATYPEIRGRVAAFVSAAGAIGGSPLANQASQYQADLLRYFPKSRCEPGDGEGVASLRPDVRRRWLATHPLPAGIRYYSLATLPEPDRISGILKSSYHKLARVDGRNDSQVVFYDQVLPGSTLLGYVNADHWALAVPIARSHATVGRMVVTHNDYPREALSEALLRFIEQDLDANRQPPAPQED